MNVIVIGGSPAGLIIEIPLNVRRIELRGQKLVIATPDELTAPIERLTYEVHPVSLLNTGEKKPNVFGIAVPDGQTLVWGMQQLMTAYQKQCQIVRTTQDDKVH